MNSVSSLADIKSLYSMGKFCWWFKICSWDRGELQRRFNEQGERDRNEARHRQHVHGSVSFL